MAFYLSGCNFISYETKPIANQQVIEKITAKDPEDPRFKEFLKIQGFKEDSLPIKEWGLNELMLCALFFNPRLEIAKKEWDVAKIQEMIAPIKAPSSVGFESGRQTTGVKENSRDAFGLSFTTLFETADKAKIREERARNQSLIKRLELRKLAWDIKTDLTLNYLRYHQLLLNLQIIRSEIKLQNEILNMLKKRKSLGLSSSIDSNFNQIELNKNIQKLNEEQYQLNETKSKLASILGISAEKLNTMRIANINMDQSIEIFSKTLDDETKQRDVINLGLFNRIDLRIALAKYAVSESQLKLNVANQYPDIRFSPAYIFDYGSSKWLLGVTSLIPTVEKNKNLVEEAKKLRDIESLQVEKIQTSIINELAKLRDNYTNAKDMVRKDTEDLSAANALENSIESKFNQGEIDRIELTQQKLITMQYKRRFYTNKITLMKIGFDFEALLQEPLNTNKNNEKYTSKISTSTFTNNQNFNALVQNINQTKNVALSQTIRIRKNVAQEQVDFQNIFKLLLKDLSLKNDITNLYNREINLFSRNVNFEFLSQINQTFTKEFITSIKNQTSAYNFYRSIENRYREFIQNLNFFNETVQQIKQTEVNLKNTYQNLYILILNNKSNYIFTHKF